VGTSSGGTLVTPPKSQYAIPTELVDDPMLTVDVLKHFQDTFKELYKFSVICLLVFVVTCFDE
jgi:tRNA (Thr-GGU) A37 N-methylase